MDYSFLVIVLMLLCYGLIMVFSASSASAHYEYGDAYYFIKRQFAWAIIGLGIMLIVSRISYKTIYKYSIHLMLASIILLILVPLIGIEVKGAKRWIGFGFFSFQPSELAKFAIIVFLARSVSVNNDALKTFSKGFLPYVFIIGLVAALVFIEPHLSGAIVVAATGFIVLWAAGAKMSHFAAIGGPALAVAVVAMVSAPYRMARVTAFFDPFKDSSGTGFQIVQSLYAIGSGGFFGVGLGQSRQKHLFLPEPQNDFIFSVICEELGFVGAALVVVLFVFLMWKGIKIASNAPDKFSKLLVIGIMGLIAVQVIINIAVVTSSIPATGMPLPFFSYGGTSLVFILAEMGVVLSVSRECEL
ncbi:MAG: putative lipid II flippase FtsW [Clostridia bacterium]|nr:putative lipid II flippase FtsW [Clostridia bacterium]